MRVLLKKKVKRVKYTNLGKKVDLKPFIENLIRDGVTGMIRSLKGCDGAKQIELVIRQAGEPE